MSIESISAAIKESRDESKDEQSLLKEALDIASQQTRNLMITFLFFVLYVGVTVAGTTHKDLLFPDSTVKMPILGVDIPLFGFYIAVPFLLLVFHFNFLFNLLQHAEKLSEWREGKESDKKLYPFLFNYVDKYLLVRFATWIIAFGGPLFLFLFIQLRFLPYHSLGMTFWHQTAVLFDILLLSLFWQKIRNPKQPDLNRTYFKKTVWKEILSVNMACLVFVALFCLKIAVIPPLDESHEESILEEVEDNALKKWATEISLKAATGKTPLPFLSHDRGLLEFINFATKDFYDKNLDLREKELIAKEPGDTIIAAYLRDNKSVDDAYMDHAKGINLSKRDLRYANFDKSKLIKADLREALLQGAHLNGTNMQGAKLSKASLQYAELSETSLQGADLSYANLQGVVFESSNLQGADLSRGSLQGVVLIGAKMEEAQLIEANLQGATLFGVNLQGAYLTGVSLLGANLMGDSLQGADLSDAYLYGALFPKKENLKGILADNINIEPVENWQKLIDEILPMVPKKRKEEFKKRMKEVEKMTAEPDYKPPVFDTDKEGFVSRVDFISIREELACEDKTIARGILNQVLENIELSFTDSMNVVVAYMKKNCPENVPDDLDYW